MSVLSRAAIDAASNDVTTEDVEVPEWGGTVRVRRLTVDEIVGIMLRAANAENGNRSSLLFYVVSCAAVDESGEPLWPTEADVRALRGKRSLTVVQRLFEATMRLNNMTEDAEKN